MTTEVRQDVSIEKLMAWGVLTGKSVLNVEAEAYNNGGAYYPLSLIVSAAIVTITYTEGTRETRPDKGTAWQIVTQDSVFNVEAEAHNNLGVVFHVRGQIDAAINEYEQALTINPTLAKAHNNLAGAYYALGLVMSAVDEWEKAISLEPSLAQTYYNLGVVHKAQGKLDLAIAAWEKALSIDTSITDAEFGLGEIYQASGKAANAIDHYRRFILQAPTEDRHYIRVAKERLRHLRDTKGSGSNLDAGMHFGQGQEPLLQGGIA